MAKQLIHQNKLSNFTNSLEYDPDTQIAYLTAKGLFTEKYAYDISERLMKYATTNSVKGVIFDSLELKGTFYKMTGFLKDQFIPHMEMHGCHFAATLFTDNSFLVFAMRQLLKVVKTRIEIRACKSVAEAEQWLGEKIA